MIQECSYHSALDKGLIRISVNASLMLSPSLHCSSPTLELSQCFYLPLRSQFAFHCYAKIPTQTNLVIKRCIWLTGHSLLSLREAEVRTEVENTEEPCFLACSATFYTQLRYTCPEMAPPMSHRINKCAKDVPTGQSHGGNCSFEVPSSQVSDIKLTNTDSTGSQSPTAMFLWLSCLVQAWAYRQQLELLSLPGLHFLSLLELSRSSRLLENLPFGFLWGWKLGCYPFWQLYFTLVSVSPYIDYFVAKQVLIMVFVYTLECF